MRSRQISVLRQTANGSTGQGCFRWTPQAGQGRGPLVLNVAEGSFSNTLTSTGTLSNGSAVVTGITNTINISPGLAVSGTGIPANTTVLSVDSATQITLSANATATGAQSLTYTGTVYDPVIHFGYNSAVGGTEVQARDGLCVFQIEGHFQRDSDDVVLMEAFLQMNVTGASGGGTAARPIFCWYDKTNKVPLSVDMSPGTASAFNVYFQNYIGEAGNPTLAFTKDTFRLNAVGTAAHRYIDLESYSTYGTYLRMSANGDSIAGGSPTMQLYVNAVGGSLDSRQIQFYGRSGGASAEVKTGTFIMRADANTAINSLMFSFGGAITNSALCAMSSVNMPTNYPTLWLTPVASQTRGVLEIDGVNNGTGAVESRKFQVYPIGYVAVRETGNTSTDRAPGTGAQSVTAPTYTNKPGSTSPSGNPTAWFPMLTTAGALCWVPGWAD